MCAMCPPSPVFPGCEKVKKIERHKMSRLSVGVTNAACFLYFQPCAIEIASTYPFLLKKKTSAVMIIDGMSHTLIPKSLPAMVRKGVVNVKAWRCQGKKNL